MKTGNQYFKKLFPRPRKLAAKFMFGIAVILISAVGLFSIFFYEELKNLYMQEAYEKADIVLGHVEATVQYVQDELRPQMYHVLGRNEFVREAMSTSFVNKGIMHRFISMHPDYIYRRVALNPMNPKDRADSFEAGLISRFSLAGAGIDTWKGLIEKGGNRYFAYFKAIKVKRQCLPCHGDPALSSKSLISRYGTSNGHYWNAGSVVGVESIAIPVDKTFGRIGKMAFSIFLIGIAGMALLFMALNYFYYLVSARPLKKASSFFKSVVGGEKALETRFEAKGDDEIAELAESFNSMLEHLKKSRDELNSSELKYRHIFEASKDAIIITDHSGTVTEINNAGLELLGAKDEHEVTNRMDLHDFMTVKTADHFLARMEKEGFVKDLEAVFTRTDGGETSVLLAATTRKEPDGYICYECIAKDITERKKIEQQMRQTDKLASIGQLAAGVAHEINNPLSVVLGYTRLIIRDAPAQIKEDLEKVHKNAQLCKKIVEDLLHFSRQTGVQYEEADINASIEPVVSVLEGKFSNNDVSIVRDYGDCLPRVIMDTDKMQQVYMNILMNACQAMGQKGSIHVSTSYEKDSGRVLISFADEGCGIPKEIQNRVFEPFFTTKEPGQGTGLGLAVSYGIIREHGGEIALESEEGRGSTFRIWLPAGGPVS